MIRAIIIRILTTSAATINSKLRTCLQLKQRNMKAKIHFKTFFTLIHLLQQIVWSFFFGFFMYRLLNVTVEQHLIANTKKKKEEKTKNSFRIKKKAVDCV